MFHRLGEDVTQDKLIFEVKNPLHLVKSERYLRTCHKQLKNVPHGSRRFYHLKNKLVMLRQQHKRSIRHARMTDCARRDAILDSVYSGSSASSAFRAIRKLNRAKTPLPKCIRTKGKTFHEDSVPDGIFESIRELKTEPLIDTHDAAFPDFSAEYKLILEICSARKPIPMLSLCEAEKLLISLKSDVNDFFSITPLHFRNAGLEGLQHFQFLLNTIINNINLSGLSELNTIYACVLHKGHGKNTEESRSYRTISTCPLISKALDKHVRNLSVKDWNSYQAPTHYQGEKRSHELACILLTETLRHSVFTVKKPV